METNPETFPLIKTHATTRLRPVARARVRTWLQAIGGGLLVTAISNAGVVTFPEDLTFQDTVPNGTIRAVAIPASPTPYAALLAGGDFTGINGSAQSYLVLLDDVGHTVEFGGYPNGSVYSIVVQPDGKILIGGAFTMVNGSPWTRLARLNADGTPDSAFAVPYPGFDSTVRCITLQTDGKILVGGDFLHFNNYSGPYHAYLVRLNTNGTLDGTFTAVLNGPVYSVTTVAGRIAIGGAFTAISGYSRPRLAQLNSDGSIDTGFVPSAAPNLAVNSIVSFSDIFGKRHWVGGAFTMPRNRAAVYTEGSLGNAFDTGGMNDEVRVIVPDNSGGLLVGGRFSSVNGNSCDRIVRISQIDGSIDQNFNANPISGESVEAICVQRDGKIIIGGSFLAGDQYYHYRHNLARLFPSPLPVDVYMDMEFGTAGAVVTGTPLAQAAHPTSAVCAGDFHNCWETVGPNSCQGESCLSQMFVSTAQEAFLRNRVKVGNTQYDDTGSARSFKVNNTVTLGYIRYWLPAPDTKPRVSMGVALRLKSLDVGQAPPGWGQTPNGSTYDLIQMDDNAGHYLVLNHDDNNYSTGLPLAWRAHTKTNSPPCINELSCETVLPVLDKWYWVTMLWDTGSQMGTIQVYDMSNWTLVGTMSSMLAGNDSSDLGLSACRWIAIGRCDNHGASNINADHYYDDLIIDYTNANFPLLP